MRERRIQWEGEESWEVYDFLEKHGFVNDNNTSNRYESFTKQVKVGKAAEIAVTLDFDPYMNYEEYGDEIYYETPWCVYVQTDCEFWVEDAPKHYATDIGRLKGIIEDYDCMDDDIEQYEEPFNDATNRMWMNNDYDFQSWKEFHEIENEEVAEKVWLIAQDRVGC